ncbi:MBL fold metallo-hydrolase RNA specificity domain-containing protein [Comamonas sp. GB3 AK4-5]|uniref:MBL fold metallo-hydrolase RNA specificity domain-containing protein n=1 Tax=Comamonas sp. GB3 AK4-5 TaxID=3231487 RepID=UPI00351EBF4A
MQITFHGAAQAVTGSCFRVEVGDGSFLIDCGMAQGGQLAQAHNQSAFAFDPREIDFVLLTHAHIDHSGLLPKLAAQGFRGPIYCTPATADLLEVLLKDSAHIQSMEAERHWRRARKGRQNGGKHAGHGQHEEDEVAPLYTQQDVARALSLVEAKPYEQLFSPHPAVQVKLRDAGHILGSAIVEAWLTEEGRTRKLVASGDLGQPGRPILRDPAIIDEADVLLIESTYGDRLHKDSGATLEELVEVISRTAPRGNVVIPAFAVGRTQELLYHFAQLARQGRLPPVEIFVDSPMAVTATAITLRHFASFDAETRQLMGSPEHLAQWRQLHFISDVEESIRLNRIKAGAVIISASGMCDAGRVLHHLHNNLERQDCAVLICGYQAAGSLGRRLVDGEKRLRLFGDDIEVRASVHTLGGFSAHADQKALLDWAGAFQRPPAQTFVVHGEAHAAQALAGQLRALPNWGQVQVPEEGSSWQL